MDCERCNLKQCSRCTDCATGLLNRAGFLWNGTPIRDICGRVPKSKRQEQNRRRMEINHNQRLIGSFVSLEELPPDAKIFIPGCA